jgi:hypothetical protein
MHRALLHLSCLALAFELGSTFLAPTPLAAHSRRGRLAGVTALRASTDTLERRRAKREGEFADGTFKVQDGTGSEIKVEDGTITIRRDTPVRRVYDTNAFGEDRHHPYFDAPEEKLAAVGRLSINQPPPAPSAVFYDEIDFDAPMDRQIAARGWEGRGDCTMAKLEHVKEQSTPMY